MNSFEIKMEMRESNLNDKLDNLDKDWMSKYESMC